MTAAASRKLVPPLLVVAAALLSFAPTLTVGEFLWDDHVMIERNPALREVSLTNVAHAFSDDVFDGKGDEYFRPLQTLQNLVDYQVWGLRPLGYHLTNLAYHVAAACLLYVLFRRLFGAGSLALIPALFFAVHPIVIEQLLIIAGRAEIMSLAFTLAALVCAVRDGRGAFALSLVLYALACLSKESGIAFPLFLLAVGWLEPRYRVGWMRYAGYGLVAAGYLVLRSFAVSSDYVTHLKDVSPLLVLRDFPLILVDYVRVILLPLDLHSHRQISQAGWTLGLGYAGAGLIAFACWRIGDKRFTFAWLWFLVGLAPKIPLLLVQLPLPHRNMLDHWVYPSAVGVFLVLALGISRVRSRTVAAALVAVPLLLWCGVSWVNAAGRGTDKGMYLWALRYPTSAVVRHNLALLYEAEGSLGQAESLADEALEMEPDPFNAELSARVKHALGEDREAAAIATAWVGRRPDYTPLLVLRAAIVRGDAGLDDLRLALEREPANLQAWALVAEINGELGRVERYREALDRIVAIDPDYPGVRRARQLAAVYEYTRLFYDGELGRLYAHFSDEARAALPLEQLAALRERMVAQYGREVRILREDAQTRGEYDGFVRWARFDRYDGVIELQWILSGDDTVAAFFIRPVAD